MAERRGTLAGPLRISAPVTFGRMHLGPALYPFLARHPRIELTLELDDRRVDAAADGYDAVVRHGAVADSRLVAWRLAPSRRVLVAAPSYLARARRADDGGRAGAPSRHLLHQSRRRRLALPGRRRCSVVRGRVALQRQQWRRDARCGDRRSRHGASAELHRRRCDAGRRVARRGARSRGRRASSSTSPIRRADVPRPSCAPWPSASAMRSVSRPTGTPPSRTRRGWLTPFVHGEPPFVHGPCTACGSACRCGRSFHRKGERQHGRLD